MRRKINLSIIYTVNLNALKAEHNYMRHFTFETIYPIFNFKKYKRNSPVGDGFSKKFLVLVVVLMNSAKTIVPCATSVRSNLYLRVF
jgi:hypothetical protein